MKALRIYEFGKPSHAILEDSASAAPGDNQVSIRIETVSVNPLDLKILAGYMQPVFPVDLPYTLGTDFAGTVETVGPNVDRFKPADRVVGRLDPTLGGAIAQSAVVHESALSAIPATMSFEQAAALPTAAGTAWLALFGVGKLSASQRVLIHAGAGGVGSFAVQFARQSGAHVTATASSKNHALLKELGAEEVIDYRNEDFSKKLRGLDLVLDSIGSDTLERSWRVVKSGGTVVSIADHTIEPRGDIHGAFAFFNHDVTALDKVISHFESKQLQVILDTIHPLDNARTALEQVAGGHACGKVIIRASR